jgi:hypothetical protein
MRRRAPTPPDAGRAEKYAPKIAIGAFPQWASWSGSSRFRPCSTSRVRSREVLQRGCPAEEPALGHPLQAVVRRERASVPHPEQHGPHRGLQGQEGLLKKMLRHRSGRQGLAQTRVWEKFN